MSSIDDDLPELPADAREAVEAAKAIGLAGPGDDVRARMRARLVGALPGGGGSGGEGGGGGGSGGVGAGLPRAPLWVVAAALAVGGAAGLLVPRAPVERIVVVNSPAASSAASNLASAPLPGLPSIDAKDLPPAPSAASAASAATVVAGANGAVDAASSARGGDDLAAERAALDVARTALGRGDGANALVACDDHARKFPRGALAEEREAIAVQALVLEHRPDDARARAERFRKTHPRSILLPAVLAAAGVEP
jgi:hypothetical protein